MPVARLQFLYDNDVLLINCRYEVLRPIAQQIAHIVESIAVLFVLCLNNKDNTSHFCVNM